MQRLGWRVAAGDKVMQTVNNYDKDVFNGDAGHHPWPWIAENSELTVLFEGRP